MDPPSPRLRKAGFWPRSRDDLDGGGLRGPRARHRVTNDGTTRTSRCPRQPGRTPTRARRLRGHGVGRRFPHGGGGVHLSACSPPFVIRGALGAGWEAVHAASSTRDLLAHVPRPARRFSGNVLNLCVVRAGPSHVGLTIALCRGRALARFCFRSRLSGASLTRTYVPLSAGGAGDLPYRAFGIPGLGLPRPLETAPISGARWH